MNSISNVNRIFILTKRIINILFFYVSQLVFIQCHSDGKNKVSHGVNGNDTIQVVNYNISRKIILNPKEWHVYYIDKDIICLPIFWKYEASDKIFFTAWPSLADKKSFLEVNRYYMQGFNGSQDSVAKSIYGKQLLNANVVHADDFKKDIFASYSLYESFYTTSLKNEIYKNCLLIYMSNLYMYQIRISIAEKYMKNEDILEDIIYNMKLNEEYIYNNSLKKIVILQHKSR